MFTTKYQTTAEIEADYFGPHHMQAAGAALDRLVALEAVLGEMTRGLVIRPGDTLILRHPGCTAGQAADMKSRIAEHLPEVRVLVVGVDGMAVFRPDEVPA